MAPSAAPWIVAARSEAAEASRKAKNRNPKKTAKWIRTPAGPDQYENATTIAAARPLIRRETGARRPDSSLLRTMEEEETGELSSISIRRLSFSGAKRDAPFATVSRVKKNPKNTRVPWLSPWEKDQNRIMKRTALMP